MCNTANMVDNNNTSSQLRLLKVHVRYIHGHRCRMFDDRKLKILLFRKMDGKNKRVDRRYCAVVQWKSAATEPLSLGPKQLAEVGEAGVGRQRALSPWLVMMTMTMIHKQNENPSLQTYTNPISERNFPILTEVPISKQLRINVLRLLSPMSDCPM